MKNIKTLSKIILASVLAIFTAQNVSAQYAKTFSIEKSPIPMEDLAPGKTVRLGTWGAEGFRQPLEWLVLRQNDDGSLMLLSRKILALSEYDKERDSTSFSDSSLGKWLDGDFYEKVFSDREKKFIVYDTVPLSHNPKYKGRQTVFEKTKSRVYLLGIEEAERLFSSDSERKAEIDDSVGVQVRPDRVWQWLRTVGNDTGTAAFINAKGAIDYKGYMADTRNGGVRPVIRYRPYKTVELGRNMFDPKVRSGESSRQMEWIVINEERDGTWILMSRRGIALMPYNEKKEKVSWHNSTLRSWLNGAFLSEFFTDAEREGILNMSDPYNPDETDRIYLPYPEMTALYSRYVSTNLSEETYFEGESSLGCWLMQKPDSSLISKGKSLAAQKNGSVIDEGVDVNYEDMPVFAVMRFNPIKYENVVEQQKKAELQARADAYRERWKAENNGNPGSNSVKPVSATSKFTDGVKSSIGGFLWGVIKAFLWFFAIGFVLGGIGAIGEDDGCVGGVVLILGLLLIYVLW